MDKHYNRLLDNDNSICKLFNNFPELNVRQVARAMGVNESLMQQYVNGTKRPSFERRVEIEQYLHSLGESLMKINLKGNYPL